jgi:hypothetical protein
MVGCRCVSRAVVGSRSAIVLENPEHTADTLIMLWLYHRESETLRLRTAFDNETQEFLATIAAPDGREQELRFVTVEAFRDWLQAFEARLDRERWIAAGAPVLLPTGWPDKPLR